MFWRAIKNEQNELARRVERLEEKKDLGQSADERAGDSRRMIIFKTILAAMGVVGVPLTVVTQWQSIFPRPKLQITSEVYSPRESGGEGDFKQNPGGINFTIRNSGNAEVLFTRARLLVEDYARLSACTYGSGPVPADFCYDVVLPINAKPGTSLDVAVRHEVRTNESTSFNLSISLSKESSEDRRGDVNEKNEEMEYLDIHVYRLHISLIQDDGTSNDVGRYVVAAPRDKIIGQYWKPDETTDLSSGQTSTKEQEIKDWGATGEVYNNVLRCLSRNESELQRVLSVESQMSSNLSQLSSALKSRTYTSSGVETVPSKNIFDCPE